MPLYEYRCRACENVFEYIQGLSEGPKRKCEECGGRLEKLVSRSGFVLKGSGWYETDFKDQGSKPPKSEANGSSPAKPAAAKKESKPAAKPAGKGEGKASPSSSGGKD
jgi:putative FmdB family regulatory protein